MNLSVKDVAGLLNVSEKTIYRMIKDETIPCFRVGGQWRFDRREIATWMEDTREFRYKVSDGMGAVDKEAVIVADILRRGGIYSNVSGDDKEAVIRACLDLISKGIPGIDPGRLFVAIMERERLCPTATGNGIAFPHPRPFREFTASLSYIALCRLERPIPFGALDHEPVDTLFFIFPKSEQRFLRIQAKLSRLLKDERVLSVVKRDAPADEVISVISAKEAEIFGPSEAA